MARETLSDIEPSEATKSHDIKTLQKLDRMLTEIYSEDFTGSITIPGVGQVTLTAALVLQLVSDGTMAITSAGDLGISAGETLIDVTSLGVTTDDGFGINGKLILIAPPVPATAAATGFAGQISWDSGFIYICVATDTWKRVAIATW